MSFIQNFFTSRDNNANSATYVGQQDRLWYDPVTNAIYVSDGNTAGGILVGGGGSGNGVPGGLANTIQINAGNGSFSGSSNLKFNGTVLSVIGTISSGNIIPAANVTYSLGNATNQWASVYVGANTLYINSVPITVDGNTLQVDGANIVTTSGSGNISTTGNVTADYFIGDGSQLTGLPAGYGNANLANIGSNAISTTGNISAGYLFGNGSQLTSISTNKIFNGTSSANIATADGNLDVSINNFNWTFDQDGALDLPANGVVRNLDSDAVNIVASGFAQLQWVDAGNINIPDPNGSDGPINWVYVDADGLTVETNKNRSLGNTSYQWIFDNTGQLTLPNTAYVDTGIPTLKTDQDFSISAGNPASVWNFDQNGNLSLPGALNFNAGPVIRTAGSSIVGMYSNINAVDGFGAYTGVETSVLNQANVTITANSATTPQTWTFDNTGVLTVPGNLNGSGSASPAPSINGFESVNVVNVNATNIISAAGNITTGSSLSASAGITTSGNIVLSNTNINNLATPVQDYDAATKMYVDTIATTGLAFHEAVFAATVGTLDSATGGTVSYNQPNGAGNGIGATLTVAGGSFDLIDTANVQTVGTRILVKNEANAAWNGAYTWANATALVRSTDADQYGPDSTEELSVNDYFLVQSGNVNAGSAFVCTTANAIVFGTTDIVFSQFSSSQTYNAGTGLTLTSQTFSVNNSQPQITSVGTLSSLSVSGGITGGNLISTTGNVAGSYILGNGSQLTGLFSTTSTIQIGNSAGSTNQGPAAVAVGLSAGQANQGTGAVSLGVAAGAVGQGTYSVALGAYAGQSAQGVNSIIINATGANFSPATANAFFVNPVRNDTTNIANIAMYNSSTHEITYSNTVSIGGNITGGNILTSGLSSTTGNITGGNILTAGLVTATGNITGGNVRTAGLVSATGNVTGGNVLTAGQISATGNVTGNNIIGNGSLLTSITGANVTGTVADAAQAAYANSAGIVTTATQLNITRLGTLVNVSVAGNVTTSANVLATGYVSATGNVTAGNILTVGQVSTTGNVTANYLFGNGSQLTGLAAQTAIVYGDSDVTIGGSGGNITANVGGVQGFNLTPGKTALGVSAGLSNQGSSTVAVGTAAGQTDQGAGAVALGYFAGDTTQGSDGIAVGRQAGYTGQGQGAIAIGSFAGNTSQGAYSIAIGTGAGASSQPANSIVLMASPVSIPDPTNSGLYIKPVRNDTGNVNTARPVYYNTTSNEVTYGNLSKVVYANVALNSTMSIDNLRFQLQNQNGGIWLFGATGTGTANWSVNAIYSEGTSTAVNAGSIGGSLSATTSFQTLITALGNINKANVSYIWTITDITAGVMYRLTWMSTTGTSPYSSYITIERL